MVTASILYCLSLLITGFLFSFSLNESSVHDAVSASIKVLGQLTNVTWPQTEAAQKLEMSTFLARTGWYLRNVSTVVLQSTCNQVQAELQAVFL
jgi:hypothetical protein